MSIRTDRSIIATEPVPDGSYAIRIFDAGDNPRTSPIKFVGLFQRRARLALLQAGLLPQAEAIFDSLPEPQRTVALIEWEYATHISRHNALVATLTPALGLSEEDVDNLFRAAAQIPD